MKKIVRQAPNSEEQFPTDSPDAPQNEAEEKVYQTQKPTNRLNNQVDFVAFD